MTETAATITTIAVIGTGIMGGPIAGRLAEAGYAVTAWNRTSDKAQGLKGLGVETVANAQDAVRRAKWFSAC